MKNATPLTIILIACCNFFTLQGYAQTLPPSKSVNLDFSLGNFNGWVGRTTVYPRNWPDANNCNQNAMVNVHCAGASGLSCNGCYSGCAKPFAVGGACPSASNPLNVPVPGVTPNCMNPPMLWAGGSLTGNYYDNTGIVSGRQTIITSSVPDPYACNSIMTLPAGEPFCARLGNGGMNQFGTNPVNPNNDGTLTPFIAGNTGVGYEIDYLSYTFLVTPSNSLLTYKYAVILQDPQNDPLNPAHTKYIQPRFIVNIRDSSLNRIIDPICGIFEIQYDTTDPGFKKCPARINPANPSSPSIEGSGGMPFRWVETAYKNWTTVAVDLRKHIGNLVTLTFNTWDCGWGGHFGYAYVTARTDSFGIIKKNNPDGSVTFTAPAGFVGYSWMQGGETTQSINVSNTQMGDTIKVRLKSTNGCTTDTYFVVDYTVGTKEINQSLGKFFMTNKNYLHAEANEACELSLYDISGKLVLSKKLSLSPEVINLEHLGSGVYTLSIISKEKDYKMKILLE